MNGSFADSFLQSFSGSAQEMNGGFTDSFPRSSSDSETYFPENSQEDPVSQNFPDNSLGQSTEMTISLNLSQRQKEILELLRKKIQEGTGEPPTKRQKNLGSENREDSMKLSFSEDQLKILQQSLTKLLDSIQKPLFSYSEAFSQWEISQSVTAALNFPYYLFLNLAFQASRQATIKYYPKEPLFSMCI
jgi:hypothetical protein